VACVHELVLSIFPSFITLVAFSERSIQPAWKSYAGRAITGETVHGTDTTGLFFIGMYGT